MANLELDNMEYSSDANAQAAYVTNGTWDSYTKLLLHCDGTNTSTSFPDAATGKTVTAVGSAQVSTAQKTFGTGSALFDGSGDYLSVADHADWDFGSGDWTVDFRVRFNTSASVGVLVNQFDSTANQRSWIIYYSGSGNLVFLGSTAGTSSNVVDSSAWTPTNGVWYHIAVVRSGNNMYKFVDGTQIGTTDDVTGITLFNSSAILAVGSNSEGGQSFDGWIDELRISKGIARWTTTFTPPTLPYELRPQSYSEGTIKTQGSYSLKVLADTSSINKTLTKTLSTNSNLTSVRNLSFDIYSSRTGANIKIGIHDAGGTTTEITPSIITANTWQKVNWNISGVSDANKDAIDSVIVTVVNADSANTFYIDNFNIAQAIDVFGMVN